MTPQSEGSSQELSSMIEVYAIPELAPLWSGSLEELIQANPDLPDWQLVMLEALGQCPAGSFALVGEGTVFRAQVV